MDKIDRFNDSEPKTLIQFSKNWLKPISRPYFVDDFNF